MPSAPSGTSFTSVSVAGAWRQKDLGSAKRFVSWSRQTYGNVGEASWTVVGSNDQTTWYIVDRQTGRNTTDRVETGTVNSSYSQYSYRYYRWISEAIASPWAFTMSHIFYLWDENGAFLSTDGAFTGSTGTGDELSYDSSTVFSFSGDICWLHSDNYKATGVYTGPTTTLAYDPTSPSGPPVTPPAAPTSLVATDAGNQSVSVSFTTGMDGGSAITNYEYSINDGSSYTAFSPSNTSSPVVISGLTSGQSYSIKLRAINSAGTGAASSSLSYTVPVPARVYTNMGAQFSKAGIVVSYTDDTGAAATQNVTFANKTLTMDSGLNVTVGKADFAGTAEIHGAAQLDSTLDVYGAGRFRSALVLDGAFSMGGALNVAGAATMGSTLAVTGATNLNNTLAVSGAASLASTLAVAGASNLNNTLAVAGAASLNSTLAVAGASNLNNTLAVVGAASLNSSLAVIGETTLTGALDVKAASHLENTLLVDGAASLGAALTVTGAATLNNGMTVNGTSTHNGALVVSGAASVGGAIGVTGAATMNSSLNVKGASRLENVLVVDGAASLGSSLAVAGAASVVGAMDVTGASRLRNSAQIDGAATLGSSLAVTGAASMASTLDVTGASRLRNNVVVDGTTSMGSSLAVTGAASMASTLAVTGAANLSNTLDVTGAASLNNTLAVSGAASMASTLAVTGAANLNSSLAVTGAANLNNTLAVSGAASLSSSLAVSGAASMSNTLAVAGAATFQNNVTVNGNLTVLGSQTAIDTTSLQVKDNAILLADGNEADILQTGIQLQYKPSGAAAVKYAGVKRQPTTGEFVFFKDSAKTIDDPSVVSAPISSINLPFENSFVDSKSNAALSSVGSIAYVSGASGGYAANFVNTAGTTASNYIKGSCSLPNSFSMTMKFKLASLPVFPDRISSRILELNSATANGIFYVEYIDIEGAEYDGFYVGYKNSSGIQATIGKFVGMNINQWYELQVSFNNSGTNVVYLDGTQLASIASGGLQGLPTTMAIGATYSGGFAFNGCIDNISFYNSILPAPSAWSSVSTDIYAVVMADSFNSASDIRLKRDIAPLEGALDKIDAIRGVQYHWIDGEQSESRQVGVIAQEIQEVYPELVREGGNGFLSVDYPKLTAVLIESIKELKAMAMALMNK